MPDYGRFVGQLIAIPRNLPFGGGWPVGQGNHLVVMPGRRLLPLAVNWDLRPVRDTRLDNHLSLKQSVEPAIDAW